MWNNMGLLTSLLFLFAFTPSANANFAGKVVGVIDGDTIEVLHNSQSERVR